MQVTTCHLVRREGRSYKNNFTIVKFIITAFSKRYCQEFSWFVQGLSYSQRTSRIVLVVLLLLDFYS